MLPVFETLGNLNSLKDSTGTYIYILCIVALFGLCMGSFLNCAAWRIVHEESVLHGRSHCAKCDHPLGFFDLIPLFSYIFLGGKCRYCKQKIAFRYLLAEIVSAAVFVSLVVGVDLSGEVKFGFTMQSLEAAFLAALLLCITFADLEDYLVPDRLIVAGIAGRLVFAIASGIYEGHIWKELLNTVIGGFSVALPLYLLVIIADKVMDKETMGGGDIKMMFMIGLYFKWSSSLFIMIIACIFGLIFGIVNMSRQSDEEIEVPDASAPTEEILAAIEAKEEQKLIPFGPSIAAATWVAMFFSNFVVQWYQGLFNF